MLKIDQCNRRPGANSALPGLTIILIVCAASFGALAQEAGPPAKPWAAEQLNVLTGFDVPECVVLDAKQNLAYVSSIATPDEGYWVDDSKGFISQITAQGDMKKLRWLDSKPGALVHAPKGMCVLDGILYFSDNTRLVRCPIETVGPLKTLDVPGAMKINDMATDGKNIYATDTGASVIYKVDPKTFDKVVKLPAPPNPNGITFDKGRMYCVSWDKHEVYELDPAGKKPPVPFGLEAHFTNLDTIELLDDGTFLVSDFTGGKICTITPDRKTVRTLFEATTPADIGIDRANGLIYVPKLKENEVAVLKIRQP